MQHQSKYQRKVQARRRAAAALNIKNAVTTVLTLDGKRGKVQVPPWPVIINKPGGPGQYRNRMGRSWMEGQ